MHEKKHTPEPWYLGEANGDEYGLLTSGPELGSFIGGLTPKVDRANAERIVACVNACAGIAEPSAVPDLVALLAAIGRDADEMREAIARYSDGETETVDALDSLYNAFGGIDLDGITAALARVRGEG